MAAATITAGSKYIGSMAGFIVYVCELEIGGTATDAVTVDTGMTNVVCHQATWATDGTTASSLICTATGGVVSVQATDEVGALKVNLLVLGQ